MYEPKPDPMIARDFVGYGEFPPDPAWPGGASIAVNFNLNVEGGGEATLANGDDLSEGMLNDIGVGTKLGQRVPLVESVFEFGSRRSEPHVGTHLVSAGISRLRSLVDLRT